MENDLTLWQNHFKKEVDNYKRRKKLASNNCNRVLNIVNDDNVG